ncbi:MAG: Uma2 family endonuclease [Chitinophagales bacterium]
MKQNYEKLSVKEYIEVEESTGIKHEYLDGFIRAMSGGSLNHSIIGGNTFFALMAKVNEENKTCIVFNNDAKVYIEKANSYLYPDVTVVCGDIETGEHEESIANPILIVEVLSKSTGSYDRGEKFRKYRSLPSFKEYVLIDQDQPIVDTMYRKDASYWRMSSTIGLDKSVKLHSLDIEVPMSEIYKNIRDLEMPQTVMDFED